MTSNIMKNCLIIYYSQSGQTYDIVRSITNPLAKNYQLHFEELQPIDPYPFPWKGMSFFQAFPESVKEIPCQLRSFSFDDSIKYDLVILAYPVWYLSPPIPLSSFLQSEPGMKVLNGTPVITILGVRNMWVMAQERVKARIKEAGGQLVGNIVLTDPYPNLVSVITIVRWMITAKRHGSGLYGKIFPPAGVPGESISKSSAFGEIIATESTLDEQLEKLNNKLVRIGAVRINPVLVNIEQRAKIMFGILARWILKKGDYNSPDRIGRLKFFKYYLFTVIYLVSPIASIVFWLISKFRPAKTRAMVKKYTSLD
jgi:hypothetical protein